MTLFALWVKLANVMAVQGSHDTDPREHRRAVIVDNQESIASTAAWPRFVSTNNGGAGLPPSADGVVVVVTGPA